MQQAAGVAATPYQAYTGELTAPVNAQQQQGIAGINANANAAQPYLTQAAGLAGNAAQPITQQQIQSYLSPYTQQVVNATQNQFNDQNARQQAGVTGNAISQGALGGNRVGVAQGVLAGQQQLAQAPVIAGLYNQGYGQAVQTAENQQQAGLAGAYGLSNIGQSVQNAGLAGAGAQVGAGTLEQQTQQAADTSNYGQYAQAQAYPFQTAQWLAGVDTAVAPGLGSSTSGTTTGPAPNQTAQYLGAGISSAALLASDRRLKDHIEKIGHLNDGQPLYRYRYKGSNEWHIGPMAQDVEKHHPEAVYQGVGGFKYIDLKSATDDSVHKAFGGPVAGLAVGGTPWSFAQGWVPTVGGLGNAAPHASSAPGLSNPQTPSMDWSKLGQIKASPNGVFASNPAYGGDNMITGAYGGSSSDPLPGLDASDYGAGFARGGLVNGYDTGGAPDDPTMADRFSPIVDAIRSGDFDPQGANSTDFQGTPGMQASNAGVVPLPTARPAGAPVVAADDDDDDEADPGAAPAASAPVSGVGAAPYTTNPAGAYVAPFSKNDPQAGFGDPGKGLGIGLGYISPNAQTGLLAAGLGMMASRSPFLGNAVGEGGLAGLTAYGAAQEQDRKVAAEAQKIADAAKLHADEMAKEARRQTETERHNKATEEKDYAAKLVTQTDPNSGETRYLTFDPKTKKLTPANVPADASGTPTDKFESTAAPAAERRKAPAASPQARDESYYDYLTTHRPPGYADIVRAVADYEIDPNREASLQKGARDRLYRDVKQFDPTYDQTHFGEKTGVIQNFSRGPASQAVNSLNVSVAHLGTLGELGDALNNGNIPLINKLANAIAVQTGRPAPTNFDAAKEIVGDEVVKAVIGGVNSQADREAIKHLILAQQTPAQLKGVIQTFTALLGGQLDGQRQRYQAGTGLNNFDEKYLAPATRAALARGGPGGTMTPEIAKMVYPSGIPQQQGATPAATTTSGFQPPPGAIPRVYNGKTYYYDPATKQPYAGQ